MSHASRIARLTCQVLRSRLRADYKISLHFSSVCRRFCANKLLDEKRHEARSLRRACFASYQRLRDLLSHIAMVLTSQIFVLVLDKHSGRWTIGCTRRSQLVHMNTKYWEEGPSKPLLPTTTKAHRRECGFSCKYVISRGNSVSGSPGGAHNNQRRINPVRDAKYFPYILKQ